MIRPTIPFNESERQISLHDYQILDTLPEEDLDNITKLASEICETPISLVSLIDTDRQWFKSKVGLAATQTPREFAFCAHAINQPGELFIVADSRQDNRFHDNPLVTGSPHVIFYAGIPLVNHDGFALGTLCIIDQKPRELNEHQRSALRILGKQVINIFELRKKTLMFEQTQKILEERNDNLEKFATMLSHDIKSPLANIISFIELFKMKYANSIDQQGNEILTKIDRIAYKLNDMVTGILSYYKSDPMTLKQSETIQLREFFESLIVLLKLPDNAILSYPKHATIVSKRSALIQIFINLIHNAIRYNNKEELIISIDFEENENFYEFKVTDNGIGIEKTHYERIFHLFSTVNVADERGQLSSGIGLSTVKKLVEKMQGNITVSSVPGISTTFSFTIKKVIQY